MAEVFRQAWTPQKVIARVPKKSIQHTPMFLRSGPYADNKTYAEVVNDLFPHARRPLYEDGESFRTFLGDLAHRTDDIILAILEATTVMVPHTSIHALRDGVRIADGDNRLRERVIPLLVVDEEWAHTKFFKSNQINPDGPKQVMLQGKQLGAITVAVTRRTLRDRLSQTLTDILQGTVPAE